MKISEKISLKTSRDVIPVNIFFKKFFRQNTAKRSNFKKSNLKNLVNCLYN